MLQETLEFALREYEGAVVVVSHDRWQRGTRGKRWWIVGEVLNPTQDASHHQDYSIFLDVCFFGYFLRIGIPWDSSPSCTTIWDTVVFDFWVTFSKHRGHANPSLWVRGFLLNFIFPN